MLEQTPIKDYTTLSNVFMWLGLCTAIISTIIIFFVKTKSKSRISFKATITKIFFFWYVLGLVIALFSIVHVPWFYAETGRYTYKCTFNDNISANYISNNFNIIDVENGIWNLEDK